jgi:hypothetical protein
MPSIKGLKRKISKRFSRRRRKDGSVNGLKGEGTLFPLLALSDDLIIHILSFVSSAPFESIDDDEPLFMYHISLATKKKPTSFSPFQPSGNQQAALIRGVQNSKLTANSFGTLTHGLPVVCKKFHDLCYQSDGLWKEAMERLTVASPTVWGTGILHIAKETLQQKPESSLRSTNSTEEDLCDKAATICGSAKGAFQRIVEVYQPFTTTAPLFLLGGSGDPPVLQQAWNLHLYEPRYRLMMSQIMQSRPVRDKNGSWIPSPGRPRFLFSSGLSAPLVEGDPVFLVEILRCKLKRDGRALLTILPVLQTRIQSMQVRPNSFALLDATVQTCKRNNLQDEELRLPVFCISAMGRIPQLYSSIELLVWENRYRRLVREIMA